MTELELAIAYLSAAGRHAYRTMRQLGLSADAAKDSLTVHLSDVLAAAQRDDKLPTPYDDGDGDGGIRTP